MKPTEIEPMTREVIDFAPTNSAIFKIERCEGDILVAFWARTIRMDEYFEIITKEWENKEFYVYQYLNYEGKIGYIYLSGNPGFGQESFFLKACTDLIHSRQPWKAPLVK